jgi:sterol desaturase/sphingolipid hydroxylase (fatty acid hydroxylase superfamily)
MKDLLKVSFSEDLMIPYIIAVGLTLMVLERLFPDQKLPASGGWWTRVVIINVMQGAVVLLGGLTWDVYFDRMSLFDLNFGKPVLEGAIAYFFVTFMFYWWHRFRHTVPILWDLLHQVHHSPTRIETITSFYKNPLEIFTNSLIIGSTVYLLLGFSLEAGAWLTLFTALGEFLYHMNIKTPQWWGYIFQRPEMHRIHHEQGRHFSNFSDLPMWDMLFGTYKNPPTYDGPCGFKDHREARLSEMLRWKNVNGPFPPKSSGGPS